jgi:zinc/manganese transport system substrate-binding protein
VKPLSGPVLRSALTLLRSLTAPAILALVFAAGMPAADAAGEPRIAVVAAENFYGGVAEEIGGDRAAVISILNNPDQDPHLFEVSPAVVREIAAANIVVANGADYDPWIERIIKVTPAPGRAVIIAADLMHRRSGDNPHLWYDPATIPAVARALAAAFAAADPGHRAEYDTRLASFLAALAPLDAKIANLHSKYAGTAVAATEPVFGEMAQALGLDMRDTSFQRAVMNDTEPSARDIAALQNDLKSHKVKVLFFNKQAAGTLVRHIVDLAQASGVAVVAVSETAPPGVSYRDWMLHQLDDAGRALGEPSS